MNLLRLALGLALGLLCCQGYTRGCLSEKDYSFLKVGPITSDRPRLVLTDESMPDIVRRLANSGTLVVTDPFNAALLKDLGFVFVVRVNTPEEVAALMDHPLYPNAKRVICVGGCGALDVGRAAAVGKEEVILIPTILSNSCISVNRSVLGLGAESFSYRTVMPQWVIVPIRDMLVGGDKARVYWSQGGFGDLFSNISAAIEVAFQSGSLTLADVQALPPPFVFDALDWVLHDFNGYDQKTLVQLAKYLHESSLMVIEAGNVSLSAGAEHFMYHAFIQRNPHLRHGAASHGQLVAIGTLMAVKIFSDQIQDPSLYTKVRSVFGKLGLPITYTDLNHIGITPDMVVRSLKDVTYGPPSFIGSYVQSHDPTVLAETVFGNLIQ